MEDKSAIRHFGYIDSLRGVAILLVIAVHTSQIIFKSGFFSSIFSIGAYGVQLFFIISAFTLFLSYEQRQKSDSKNTNLFFFIRRFFRIAPAFYLAICLYVLSLFLKNHILLGYFGRIEWVQILVFASFLSVFYPASMFYLPFGGWTVEVEMIFYLFIPWLFKIVSSLRRAVLFFFFTLIGYFALNYLFVIYTPLRQYSLYLEFPNQIPVFALGILIFHITREYELKVLRPYLILFLLLIYLFLAVILSNHLVFLPQPILVSLFFGGLVLLMSAKPVFIIENKVAKFIGKISYSLYLWHFIIILFFWYLFKATSRFGNMPQLLSFLIIYVTTLLVGAAVSRVSFKYIETAGINFGKKLIVRFGK
jgi:peptidoglycan/LPS O-acetylase OafA/YrhL